MGKYQEYCSGNRKLLKACPVQYTILMQYEWYIKPTVSDKWKAHFVPGVKPDTVFLTKCVNRRRNYMLR